MLKKDGTQTLQFEAIALPPLSMALYHAVEERLAKAALASAAGKAASRPVAGAESLEKQSLKRIIEHLEKKS
jgi:hypothetical protein